MVKGSRLVIAIATSVLFGATSVAFGSPSKGGSGKGGAPRATSPKGGTTPAVHPTKPNTPVTSAGHAKAPKTTSAKKGGPAEHSATTTTTSTTTTSTTLTVGPTLDPKIATKLERDNGLTRRLQSRLGELVDLQVAAAGYTNLGLFVATVNNSSSADQFWQLRALMTGYNMDGTPTGAPTLLSLGQAKQELGIVDVAPE